jgi:hypothetical protein
MGIRRVYVMQAWPDTGTSSDADAPQEKSDVRMVQNFPFLSSFFCTVKRMFDFQS